MATDLVGRRAGWTAAVGFGILIGSFVAGTARDGQAQKKSQDVFVVNTATDAIPIAAQGTTNIAGAVTIDPTANTVQVASSASSPVWIRDVDSARQPFQIGGVITIPDGQLLANATLTTVPAGKRLVIEYVSSDLMVPTGEKITEFVIQSPPFSYSHFLTPVPIGGNSISDVFAVSQQLRLYANPGQGVLASASRNDATGPATVLVSISGYFVDVP